MNEMVMRPYLFFAGRCGEALEFYEQTLGAKVEMLMRFNESPDAIPEGVLQEGFEDKVMHATLRIGSTEVLASDGRDDKSTFEGFRLALTLACENDADQVFAALSDGGTIDMPLTKTFWSPRYGMVTDKFNVGWMIMVAGEST